jgi:hypothetical protein
VGHRAGLDTVAERRNPSPCRESNPIRPVRSLVTILTELSRLLLYARIAGGPRSVYLPLYDTLTDVSTNWQNGIVTLCQGTAHLSGHRHSLQSEASTLEKDSICMLSFKSLSNTHTHTHTYIYI